MKSIKNHLSLIIALFTILFMFQTYIVISKTVKSYENNLLKKYSIFIHSYVKIEEEQVKRNLNIISRIEKISKDEAVKNFTNNLSNKDLELTKAKLGNIYKIYLKKYPSPQELRNIDNYFKSIEGVNIETFEKAHNQIYSLLILFKYLINILAFIVIFVSILLILREMKLWQYEHKERMLVMSYFGAPIWLRSSILFKLAIIDAIISFVLINIFLIIIKNNNKINDFISNIAVNINLFDIKNDSPLLLAVAIITALLLATSVMITNRN